MARRELIVEAFKPSRCQSARRRWSYVGSTWSTFSCRNHVGIRRRRLRQSDMILEPDRKELLHRPYLNDLANQTVLAGDDLFDDPELDLLFSFVGVLGLDAFPALVGPER
ncbi:hypothetical protein [Exiguobacterium artemiae]|uniref:hypothetical protein n=1 Tax=Exiguobacterium artemiae TaxID=340145 RepID=UPI0011D061DE|nr:hypothetical protein [Exiguobacterium sibiricum]